MKIPRLTLLLTVSLGVNAALVALIMIRAPVLFSLPGFGPFAAHSASPGPRHVAPSPPGGSNTLSVFADLEKSDLKSVIARLRAAGASPAILRAVAVARINELLYAQRAALAEQIVAPPYWKGSFGRMDPKISSGMNALGREQQKMMREALGADADGTQDDPISAVFNKNQNGGIASETMQQVRDIQSDYMDLKNEIWGTNTGVLLPEDFEKLAYLDREMQADIAKSMSPADYFEYRLRNTGSAAGLRYSLQAFAPTEEEFRAIFKAQQDFDQRFGSLDLPLSPEQQKERNAHQSELTASLQDILGPDRFAEYKQKTDPNYITTNSLVERLGLPSSVTEQVVSVQQDISGRADAIRKDAGLSQEDRNSQLASLADEATARLTSALGDRGLSVYKDRGGWWLQNLKPPSK